MVSTALMALKLMHVLLSHPSSTPSRALLQSLATLICLTSNGHHQLCNPPGLTFTSFLDSSPPKASLNKFTNQPIYKAVPSTSPLPTRISLLFHLTQPPPNTQTTSLYYVKFQPAPTNTSPKTDSTSANATLLNLPITSPTNFPQPILMTTISSMTSSNTHYTHHPTHTQDQLFQLAALGICSSQTSH
eukprot:GHVN01063447.1.p1 GENE.GHVN01063447.1~~GHVN01063447.1.p1  ORF type:complete len:188 (+),score=26.93 GHVN01063447.1:1342-1905(+)